MFGRDPASLRDVMGDAGQPDDPAIGVVLDHARPKQATFLSRARDDAVLALTGAGAGGDRRRKGLAQGSALVLGDRDIDPVLSQDLIAPPAQEAKEEVVDELDPTRRVEDEGAQIDARQQVTEASIGGTQRAARP